MTTTNINKSENYARVTVCFHTYCRKEEFVPDITHFSEIIRGYEVVDVGYSDTDVDEYGDPLPVPLPDEEWYVANAYDTPLLYGRDAIEAETGSITEDSDRWEVKYIDECNEDEWKLILKYYKEFGICGVYIIEDLREAILSHFGLTEVVYATAKNAENDEDEGISATITLYGKGGRNADICYRRAGRPEIVADKEFVDKAVSKGVDPIGAYNALVTIILRIKKLASGSGALISTAKLYTVICILEGARPNEYHKGEYIGAFLSHADAVKSADEQAKKAAKRRTHGIIRIVTNYEIIGGDMYAAIGTDGDVLCYGKKEAVEGFAESNADKDMSIHSFAGKKKEDRVF